MTVDLRRAAALAAAALVLAACSGGGADDATPPDTNDPSPAASASPTAGTLVGSDTFALTLPDGWLERSAGDALLLAVSGTVVDGFATNLNVVEDSTLAELGRDELQVALEEIATAAGGTELAAPVEAEVDSEPAARLGSLQAVGSVQVWSEQIAVAHAGTGYVVTVSFSPTTTQAARNATVDEIMTTWTWAG